MCKKTIRNIFLFLLLSAVFVELGLSLWLLLQRYREGDHFTPFYALSTVDTHGQRISQKQGPLRLKLDPFLEYVAYPNQRNKYFTIDKNGFRSSQAKSSVSAQARFVILGGSAAFGSGLTADTETLAAQLAGQIPERDFLNAALPGYTSKHELASAFWNFASDNHIRAYIAVNGFNDSTAVLCQEKNESSQIPEAELRAYQNMSDYNLIRRIVAGGPRFLFASTISMLAPRRACAFHLSSDLFRRGAEKYVLHLKRLRELALKQNADVFCYLQPNANNLFASQKEGIVLNENGQGELFSTAYALFRREVFRLLEKETFTCTDLNTLPTHLTKEMFLDPIHMNAAGNKVLAEHIAHDLHSYVKPEKAAQ
jgi:hypothetical protein